MKSNEAILQEKIIDYLVKIGWQVLRINTVTIRSNKYKSYWYANIPTSKGIPDLLVFNSETYFFLEVKDKGKKPNENQKLVFEHFNYKKIPYCVIDCFEDLEIYLETS